MSISVPRKAAVQKYHSGNAQDFSQEKNFNEILSLQSRARVNKYMETYVFSVSMDIQSVLMYNHVYFWTHTAFI